MPTGSPSARISRVTGSSRARWIRRPTFDVRPETEFDGADDRVLSVPPWRPVASEIAAARAGSAWSAGTDRRNAWSLKRIAKNSHQERTIVSRARVAGSSGRFSAAHSKSTVSGARRIRACGGGSPRAICKTGFEENSSETKPPATSRGTDSIIFSARICGLSGARPCRTW